MDQEENIISQYNPYNKRHGQTYPIAENEEIIGVYGNKDNGKSFKNFGFIVKVKQTQE